MNTRAALAGFAGGAFLGALVWRHWGGPPKEGGTLLVLGGLVALAAALGLALRGNQKRLQEKEDQFLAFFEQGGVGFAITDDTGAWRHFNRRLQEMTGYGEEELRALSWKDLTPPEDLPEEVRRFSSALERGEEEVLLEKRYLRRDGTILDAAVTTRILRRPDGSVRFLASILQDITERKEAERALRESQAQLVLHAQDLERHQEALVASMAILAEYRDEGTGEHIRRTQSIFHLMLERSGGAELFPPEHMPLICRCAALHDIGKVAVPDRILLKPGPLTPEEFAQVKIHPLVGAEVIRRASRILGGCPLAEYARQIVEYHHERWDGSGYPHGLRGEGIPYLARVMAVVDVYDALVSQRPYKQALPHREAVEILTEGSGSHFDPRLVRVFLGLEGEFQRIALGF